MSKSEENANRQRIQGQIIPRKPSGEIRGGYSARPTGTSDPGNPPTSGSGQSTGDGNANSNTKEEA
jgi:hypothetical protein